jgi:hypothetical protein
MKLETRIPKPETRIKPETRMSHGMRMADVVGSFGFGSDFWFRVSGFSDHLIEIIKHH